MTELDFNIAHMNFRCPGCGKDEQLPRNVCGEKIRCAACGMEYDAIPLVEIIEENDIHVTAEQKTAWTAKQGVFAAALAEVLGTDSAESASGMPSQNAETEIQRDMSVGTDPEVAVPDPMAAEIDAIESDIVDGLLADIELDPQADEKKVDLADEVETVTVSTEPQPVSVPDGLPLTEAALSNVGAPHGIVFDGVLVRSVNSWKDCYLALCEKLMSIDMSKFDGLPKNPFFKRFFIRAIPHKKYPDCYSVCCGTSGDVRIKTLSAGFYFYKPKYIVSQLLELYGVDPARVTIKV